jgi:hypothetical protein
MNMIEWIRRGLLIFLAGFLAVVMVAIGMYFLVLQPAAKSQVGNNDSAHSLVKGDSKQHAEDEHQSSAENPEQYLVPQDRIPKTQEARYNANFGHQLVSDSLGNL